MRTASSWLAVFLAVLGGPRLYAETGARLDLTFVPSQILLGTPFSATLTLTNIGASPIHVPRDSQILMTLRWQLPDVAGLLPARPGPTHSGHPTLEPLAPGRSRLYLISQWAMPRPCASGVYTVRAIVDMRPWVKDANAWAVSSAERQLEVLDPTGDDLAAYRRVISSFPSRNISANVPCAAADVAELLGDDVLKYLPTSTYAAYVVWRMTGARGTAASDAAKVAEALRSGLGGVVRWVACPPGAGCVPGQEPAGHVPAEQAIDWSARWINIVLQAHPDIWFADELRFRLALDEIIEGKSAAGAGGLEALAKSGRPDIAEKAGRLLTLVKEKGLVK